MAASSWYKMGAVYGGIAIGALNPGAGLGVAVALWKYGTRLEEEEAATKEAAREQSRTEFREKFYARQSYASYGDYLRSPVWTAKRKAVLQRSMGMCEHEGCCRSADEVHHLYYPQVWGRESLDALKALCEEHHRAVHGKNRNIKGADWADHEENERSY